MRMIRRLPRLPKPAADAHKGDLGTVVLVAGSAGMLGAAILCARAAMRSGAGLVRVGLPEPLLSLLPLSVPEATTFVRTKAALRDQVERADAVVIGPGMTAASMTKQLVHTVLKHSRGPVVVDADALNVLAPMRGIEASAPIVLTPHPGEAGRLLGSDAKSVQADRMAAAQALCERSGATVVLKGSGTLVADGERCYRNLTGNPGMASAGSGDVLAGLLGALLARGLAPFDAACLGAYLHGKAGDEARDLRGASGLVASDIVDAIVEVMR